jgi:hypothetical protein
MRDCIYCGESKEDEVFTLEHVIPQSLGGAYAPDELKTRDVCKDCNSNLGLFVDASFEKNHFVSNMLHLIARNFFDPANPTSLPLCCHGYSELVPPGMTDTEICELWLGPFGESVYWIRSKDERMHSYAGGNPRTAKRDESRAYFSFTKHSNKNIGLVLLSFRDAFGKRKRKVKKISRTTVEGFDLADVGFSAPDDLDRARISYFLQQTRSSQQVHGQMTINAYFDQRFMSKLAIGLSHVLFDGKVRNSKYSQELRKGLWFRPGEPLSDKPLPKVRGITTFSDKNLHFNQHLGVDYGVTVTVCPVDKKVGVILNIGRVLAFAVMCAELKELSEAHIFQLGKGISLVLLDPIQRRVELTTPELIAHNLGMVEHPELSEIEKLANERMSYFQNL